jgi:nucleoside-diphosphate-sugar epimerase
MVKSISKVFVTGAAGFIGSHIVDRLLSKGYEVIAFDDLSTGNLDNIPKDNKNCTFVKGDIRKYDDLKHALKDVDAVFHEAAFVSVPLSIEKPFECNDLNVNGTLNVLLASINSNVKRFVFASTSAVYGKSSVYKEEVLTPQPSNPYGVSKLAAEHYVRSFYELYGLETVTLRYFNVYGPRQSFDTTLESGGAITLFFNRLVRDMSPIIFGDGEQTRDFVYVQDVVTANMLALETPTAYGDFFNIASGQQVTINSVVDILKKQLHKESINSIYAPERVGDDKHGYANVNKAATLLGYYRRFELHEGLKNLVEWYNKKS